MKPRAARWFLAASALLAVAPAAAQVAPDDAGAAAPPTEADAARDSARAHFQRGVGYIEAERWADAITELRAAQELRVTASVMYNLGLAYRAVGRNREAMAAFREFTRLSGAAANPEIAARVDAYTRELGAGLTRIALEIEPPTARVVIDGAAARANESVEVDPGRHVVLAEAEGFASETRTVEVARGAQTRVVLRMVPSVLSSRVTVRAEPPGAVVRIDGQTVGFGTVEETVRAGPHSLDVSAPGYTPLRRTFEALAGQTQTIRATLGSNRGVADSPWFWVGVSAVAVGAGVAAWFLLQDLAPPYQGTLGAVTDAVHVGGWR